MKNIFGEIILFWSIKLDHRGAAQHQHQTGVKSFIQSRNEAKLPKLLDDGKQNYFPDIWVSVKTNVLFDEKIVLALALDLLNYTNPILFYRIIYKTSEVE